MPASGVIAYKKPAALNVRGEAGKRAVPHHDALSTSLGHGPLHALGLFTARTFVNQNRPRQSPQHLFFERMGNALGWILPDTETDRGGKLRRIQARRDVGAGVRDAESFVTPAPRQRRQRLIALRPIRPAFEQIVTFFRANRKQAKLRET